MADDRIDFGFGVLNPAITNSVSKRYPSTTGINATTLLYESISNVFKTDTLKAVGRIKAVVLRIESSKPEPGEWWGSDKSLEDEPHFVKVKARIPELHPFPIPESNEDHKVINLYPTFKAQSKTVVQPEVGQFIWVDFGNRETQEDPIYLGPVLEGKTIANTFGTSNTTQVSNERKEGTLNAQAASGDNIGRESTVSSNVPIKKLASSPTYSRKLNDIDFNLVPKSLIDKWDPRNTPEDGTRWRSVAGNKSRFLFKNIQNTSDKNTLRKNEKWTIIIMASAEVIERYWRQDFPNARVIITSHFRSMTTKNHNGGAIDFKIKSGDKELTALQAWSGIMKLSAAGNLPDGGRGVYFNVSKKNGIKSLKPEDAGKGASSFAAPPGGSAAPHYDFRGYYGFRLSASIARSHRRDLRRSEGYKWISLDLTGEGRDDIPGAYSGVERRKALNYLQGKKVKLGNENSKHGEGIHPSLRNKIVTAEGTSGRDLNFLYDFYNGGWSTYKYSPDVSQSVPNLLEVLNQGSKKEKILVNKENSSGTKEASTQVPKPKEG